MLFRQLEYFVALADERHFARAAVACYVSQSALSEAIQKLERELDVSLVRRGHAFEGLTPEGERLVLWARRILADHDAMKQEVSAMQTGLSGRLQLGVIPAASTTVAHLIDRFAGAHPLVGIDVAADLSTTAIIERVRHFEYDAGLIYLDQTLTIGLDVVSLYLERHVLLVPAGFLPDNVRSLSWAEAARLPLCLLKSSMHGRRIVDSTLIGLGLVAEPQVETDSIATLGALVDSGRWAGIIPRPWAQLWARPPATRLVELVDPVVRSEVGLVTNPGAPGSMVARAFVACAHDQASAGLAAAVEHEPSAPGAPPGDPSPAPAERVKRRRG